MFVIFSNISAYSRQYCSNTSSNIIFESLNRSWIVMEDFTFNLDSTKQYNGVNSADLSDQLMQ